MTNGWPATANAEIWNVVPENVPVTAPAVRVWMMTHLSRSTAAGPAPGRLSPRRGAGGDRRPAGVRVTPGQGERPGADLRQDAAGAGDGAGGGVAGGRVADRQGVRPEVQRAPDDGVEGVDRDD